MRGLGRVATGLALCLAVMAALAVGLAGPGYRFGWWGLGPAFTLLRWGAGLGLVASGTALVAIGASATGRTRARLALGILALAVALAAFAIPWRMQSRGASRPADP